MDEIDVPYHFLCPISLQLMRDPVTISTGITYDRENIEKWLFSCKNKTCPVTKQALMNDEDLTPNHTLRRLIQSWCTLNASLGIERIPTPRPPIDKTQIAKLISDAKRFPDKQLIKTLRRLKSIALESERNRRFLEDAGGVDFLASIIKKDNSSSVVEVDVNDESQFGKPSDEALAVLCHLMIPDSQLRKLITSNDGGGIIEPLVLILKNGNYQSRAYSTMLLKSLFEVADPIHLINIKTETFMEIVKVLQDQISQQASKAALKLLVEALPWRRNRIKAVEGGAVTVLIELLLDHELEDKRLCELVLIVLDLLCGCAEGRAEMLNHGAGLAVVAKKILKVSHAASDRAVRILCSICKFSATPRVLQEMLQVGVVAKLCLVLQVDGCLKSKERAREILKLHSRVWSNSPCIPPHLMPFNPS